MHKRPVPTREPFARFMGQVLEDIDPIERMRNAQSVDELRDSDLVFLLQHAMAQEGVRPLSTADNLLAHLRDRIARAESRH